MMRIKWVLGLAASSFLVVGCFGGCGDLGGKAAQLALEKATGVSVDGDGSMKIKTKDGELEITGNEAEGITFKGKDGEHVQLGGKTVKPPAGFPLAIIEGATIGSSIAGGKAGQKTYMLVAQLPFSTDPETVAAFYQKELEDKGLTVERSEFEVNGLISISLSGKSESGTSAGVMVAKNTEAAEDEGDRAVNVTLSWEQAKAE